MNPATLIMAKRPVASSFNPATTVGLSLWLDAADASKFTYGTGTQVASWIDKSPNVFTVSKSPTVNTVRSDTINGLSCITTAHYQEQLTRASTPVRALIDSVSFTDCMTFVVRQSVATTQGGWMGLTTTNYRVSYDDRGAGAGYIDIANSAGGRMISSLGSINGVTDLIAIYRSGSEMRAYRNGVQVATKSGASGSIAAAESSTLCVLCPPAGGFVGKIGEIYHVSRYNATDFAAIQTYLNTKWAVY